MLQRGPHIFSVYQHLHGQNGPGWPVSEYVLSLVIPRQGNVYFVLVKDCQWPGEHLLYTADLVFPYFPVPAVFPGVHWPYLHQYAASRRRHPQLSLPVTPVYLSVFRFQLRGFCLYFGFMSGCNSLVPPATTTVT